MRRILLGLAVALALPFAAHAQSPAADAGEVVESARQASARGEHEEALSLYVRAIARKPNDAMILRLAGEEALAIGDNDAAFGFLGRAVNLSPRDARARAGYGRALAQAMRPKDALTLFDQAVRLGMNEADIAGDRGLARDLLGENRRAQKDYRLALAAYPGKGQLIERLGLSLAISGERDAATALVRPLAQRTGNGNTWRTLAFIHAISGDVGTARRIAAGIMPAEQADSYAPFFARIALLDDEEKAAAVFLGRLPKVRLTRRDQEVPARLNVPDGDPEDMRSAAVGHVPAASPAQPVEKRAEAERRARPMAVAEKPGSETIASPEAGAPDRCAALSGGRKTQCEADARALERRCGGPRPRKTAECNAYRATREAEAAPKPTGKAKAVDAKENGRKAMAREGSPLDACEKLSGSKAVQCKADARALERRCGGARPQKTAECASYADRFGNSGEQKPETAKRAKSPERHWVQVASGRNRADLPKEWTKLKGRHALLGKRTPYVADAPGTNRLLIGPFDSTGDARDVVNRLSAAGLSTFPWTSEAGEEVGKLATR